MTKRVRMTEDEWISLCDRSINPETKEEFFVALPICCGNVSAFRDAIIELHGRCGIMSTRLKAELLTTFEAFKVSHDEDEPGWGWEIINKLMAQVNAIEV